MTGRYFYFTAHILGLVFMYFLRGTTLNSNILTSGSHLTKKNLKVPYIPKIFKFVG